MIIIKEIRDFKHAATSVLQDIQSAIDLDLLRAVLEYKLKKLYPNIKIFLPSENYKKKNKKKSFEGYD